MCMTLAVILGLILFTFFAVRTWSFWGLKYVDIGYLVNATPLTVLPGFFQTLQVFLSRSEDVHDTWV